jgi:hypothetical protein
MQLAEEVHSTAQQYPEMQLAEEVHSAAWHEQ